MRVALCIALAIAALPWGAAGADDCPAGRAVYTVTDVETGETAGEARLSRREDGSAWSNLGMTVTDVASGRSWRFGFTASSGYSIDYLVPDEGTPSFEDGTQVIFLKADAAGLLRRVSIPQADDPAPDAFLAPQLGVEIWYGTSVSSDRSYFPMDVWHRTSCGG